MTGRPFTGDGHPARRLPGARFSSMRSVLAGLLGLLAAGCSTPTPPASMPDWIANPKMGDSLYAYQVGQATGAESPEAARAAAYENALATISREILSKIEVREAEAILSSGFTLRGAEILPGCVYTRATGHGYDGWVQVSYPLAEKRKIRQQVDTGEKLGRLWTSAQAAAQAGQYGLAQADLKTIVAEYAGALRPSFELEEAQVLLGDTWRAQKDPLQALQSYERVMAITTSEPWKKVARERLTQLPPPPRFWPMRERWGGRKVALLCLLAEGGDPRPFTSLAAILLQDGREVDLPMTDIASSLPADTRAAVFSERDFSAAAQAAVKAQAEVVWVVLSTVDPDKRGQTQVVAGVDMPVLDMTIDYIVLRADDGTVLHRGQFREIAGNQPESRVAERAAGILIRKYLVPSCPAWADER